MKSLIIILTLIVSLLAVSTIAQIAPGIPGQPSQPEVITAEVNFYPETLNKHSKGKYVLVTIELPEGYNVTDIDISTIKLNDIVSPLTEENWERRVGRGIFKRFFDWMKGKGKKHVPGWIKNPPIVDTDNDGLKELEVRFSRQEVAAILPRGNSVEIKITGNLKDGTPFEGTDTIRVINPEGISRIYWEVAGWIDLLKDNFKEAFE
jgi:hypothetical protein